MGLLGMLVEEGLGDAGGWLELSATPEFEHILEGIDLCSCMSTLFRGEKYLRAYH
jgi:hypothetical protein